MAYFGCTYGSKPVIAAVTAVSDDLRVFVSGVRATLELTAFSEQGRALLDRGVEAAVTVIQRRFKSEMIPTPDCDSTALKANREPLVLAQESRVVLYYFEGGVTLVYDSQQDGVGDCIRAIRKALKRQYDSVVTRQSSSSEDDDDDDDDYDDDRSTAAKPTAPKRRQLPVPNQAAKKARECNICFEESSDGVLCSHADGHFVCTECFNQYIHSLCTDDNRLARGNSFPCPHPECGKEYSDKQIVRHMQDDNMLVFMAFKQELSEHRAVQEYEQQRREKEERLRRMSRVEREAENCRQYITESILNLCCPRCGAVFVDFSGCFALTCSQCSCAFCAWCLSDCGNDAHACAAACSAKNGGGGGYFDSDDKFHAHHRQRRQALLDAHMQKQSPEVQEIVKRLCQRDAADVGLKL